MSEVSIVQLVPSRVSADALTDAELLSLYSPADRTVPRLRANFVSSIDGSASAGGLSGPLGAAADKRVFDLLRQLSDVVVVGAGTIRAEGYGPLRLSESSVAWRREQGLAEHPPLAIVSASLRLDPSSTIFSHAPVRPLVLTTSAADPTRRAALGHVADLVECGDESVEPARLVAELIARGMTQLHCEGGPMLFGGLIEADVVDELCITLSPVLEGGAGPRISHHDQPSGLRAMALDLLVSAGSVLLARYSRDRSHDAGTLAG